jgi:Ca2+-binding RTX toxin-like protein
MDHTSPWSGRARVAAAVLLLSLGLSTNASAQSPKEVKATIDAGGTLRLLGPVTGTSISVSGGSEVTVIVNGARLTPRLLGNVRNGQVRAVVIQCGPGDDVVNCGGCSLRCTINGGAGKDTLIGGSNNDTINGGDGDDVISGNGGNDSLNGGAGKDTINGGAGIDTISGGADDDTIDGGIGQDTITGGPGADKITLGPPNTQGDPGVFDRLKDFPLGGDTKTDASNVGWSTIR